MKFKEHSTLKGLHAFFGASNYHWTNYDDEKMKQVYLNHLALERGTELHVLAEQLIRMKVKLPKSMCTLNSYVNDAIKYDLIPEQVLYYSENFFGTADAINFNKGTLRIHDLKTGQSPANIRQLEVYAALFCLEYGIKPGEIEIELRIYQNDEIMVKNPTAEDIAPIMDKIISFDKKINLIKEEL